MKRLIVAATIFLLILTLCACTGAQTTSSLPETSESPAASEAVREPVSAPESEAEAPVVEAAPQKPAFVPPANYNDVAQTAEECDAIRAQVDYQLFPKSYSENEYWDLFALGEASYPVREFLNRAGFYPNVFASPADIDQNTLIGRMLRSCRPCGVGEACFGDDWHNYSDTLFPILNSILADPNNQYIGKDGGSMYLREQVEDAARYFFGDAVSIAHQSVKNSPAWMDWQYYAREGVYLVVPTGGYGYVVVLRSLTDNGDGILTAEVVYIGASYDTYYDPDSAAQGAMPNFNILVTDGNTERYERDTDGMTQYLNEHSVRHILTLKVLPDGGYNILSQTLEYPAK